MAMDPELRASLAQTIYVASRSGFSGGAPSFGTPASRSARVEEARQVVQTADGTSAVTDHLVIVEAAIGINDRVWLPGTYSSGSDGNPRTPKRVDRHVDENGDDHHYEVFL